MLKNTFFRQKVCSVRKKHYLCIIKTSRSGAGVARWAHNPKVIGSNPFSATKARGSTIVEPLFFISYTCYFKHKRPPQELTPFPTPYLIHHPLR